jgi:hypothetical protein
VKKQALSLHSKMKRVSTGENEFKNEHLTKQ